MAARLSAVFSGSGQVLVPKAFDGLYPSWYASIERGIRRPHGPSPARGDDQGGNGARGSIADGIRVAVEALETIASTI